MNDLNQFALVRKALKKLYPTWLLFIDEVMDLLQPFWLGNQSRDEVHFIHLIGYGKRQKAREILTDMLELLDWQNESLFLWGNSDMNAPSSFAQVQAFQESYAVFPKVVMTDFLTEFFHEYGYGDCSEGDQVKEFLTKRQFLDFSFFEHNPSDARGALVISFLDSFNESDYLRTRLMFHFLWGKSENSDEFIRNNFIPDELLKPIENGTLRVEELVFFSKDEPFHVLLAIELQNVAKAVEAQGSELLGFPLRLTSNAMDYFLGYVFYKKLSSSQLHRVAKDFFLPVFNQYPRFAKKIKLAQSQVQLDFQGGWKFQAITN